MLLFLLACTAPDPVKSDGEDTAVGVDDTDPETDADTDTDSDTDTDTDSDTDTDTDTDTDSDTDTDTDSDTDTDTDSDTDSDTDTAVDTACLVPYYTDADGDGFGDVLAGSFCTPPAGTAEVDGDCDDTDATVSPAGTDVCGDRIDQDCDGIDAECATGGAYDVDLDAYASWLGDDQWLGYQVAPAGDIDGDGVDDLVFSSSYASSSSGGGGSGRTPAVSVVYGASFASGSYQAISIPEKWLDYSKNDWDISGDFDGDGVNEVAWVGYDSAGNNTLDLLWGDGSRWTDSGTLGGDVALEAALPTYFGSDLAVGDADGDGLDDLITALGLGAGIIYGDTTRIGSGLITDHPALSGTSRWFGGGGVALGDLDGDGLDDFVVTDVYDGMSGSDAPGAVYIAYSDARLTADLALPGDEDAVLRGPTGMGLVYMGYELAAGDLDGDGYEELAVGAHSYDSANGIVWVFAGSGTRRGGDYASTDASGYVYGATANPLGVAIDMVDDLDGDGGQELFIGATSDGAFVFFGGTVTGALTDADASISLTGGPADSRLGLGLTSGDIDGDGTPDLVTSGYNAYGSGDGTVWMFSGAWL